MGTFIGFAGIFHSSFHKIINGATIKTRFSLTGPRAEGLSWPLSQPVPFLGPPEHRKDFVVGISLPA